MARASPAVTSFNAGELSPRLAGRTDTEKYNAGCKTLENFLPLIQGPATRRGGFKMVAEVKDSTARTWQVRFEFSTTEAYVLEFGNLYVRFYYQRGQVVSSPNVPYEIVSPYSTADLISSDGTFALRIVQSADVLYICHPSFQTRKLTRAGPTSWAFTTLTPTGGPFKAVNTTTTTVYASAQSGAVTLTASTGIFTAAMVGSTIQLKERSTASQIPWRAGETVSAGNLRRHDGKNYAAVANGTTGSDPPVHTVGTVNDGGVDWLFQDRGDGYATITGFTSSTVVSATVVNLIPALATGVGNPTTRWAFGAWSAVEGWPTHVAFFRERLVFGRGVNVWLSVSGDFENFDTLDASGLVVADSAIVRTLTSNQVNSILWMEVFSPSSEALMIGTAGAEFAIRSQTESQPFGPDNISAQPVSTIGSRNVVPVRVGTAILFIQKSGKKLQDLTYDFYSGANGSNDQTLYADHILVGQVNRLAWQQEPFSIIWAQRADKKLVAMTYSREQYPSAPHGGWHRHPVTSCDVEDIVSIPTADRNELWAILRITIGGVDRRFVCYQTPDFGLYDDPQTGFFVDLGLSYDGSVAQTLLPGAGATVKRSTNVVFMAGAATFASTDVGRYIYQRYSTTALDDSGESYTTYVNAKALITGYTSPTAVTCTITAAFPSASLIASGGWRMTVTTLTGLGHLEGQTVDVLVDGATHPQAVVAGGSITLQSPGALVHVGLPMPSRLQTMRMNSGAQDGTSQAKKSRVATFGVRLLNTLGLKVGSRFDAMDTLDFRTPQDLMDNAPPLFTGDLENQVFPGDWNTNPWLCFEQPDPLPCTIVGVYPQVLVSDKG